MVRSALVFVLSLTVAEPAQRTAEWRGRTVTYEVVNGVAVAEGDIVLGTAEELQAGSKALERRDAVAISRERYRWPDGIIPYVIDPDFPDAKRITDAIEHWTEKTNIKLVARGSETNYVRFVPADGVCSSRVGMTGGEQKINLGTQCTTVAVIHEIGHAVGLFHEQSRADREKWLRYNAHNVDKRTVVNFAQPLNDGVDLEAYDYGSIMHYDFLMGSRNGFAVLESIPAGIPFGAATGLSPTDVNAVKRMYAQPVEGTTITSWPTGAYVRVDGQLVRTPKTYNWEVGSTHVVSAPTLLSGEGFRYVFGRWSDDGEADHTITVSPDTTVYTANYILQFRVSTSVNPSDAGTATVSPSAAGNFYTYGQEIEISAVPNGGYQLVDWAGKTAVNLLHGGSTPKVTVPVFSELKYAANFTDLPLTTVTSEPPGLQVVVDGRRVLTPHSAVWEPGTNHTVALPAGAQSANSNTVRYLFRGWSDDGAAEHVITAASAGATLSARFETQHHVSVLAYPAEAGRVEVTPRSDDGFYTSGTVLRLQPVPTDGRRFGQWAEDITGATTPGLLAVDEQKLVIAIFGQR